MSFSVAVALIAVLDALVIAAVCAVCGIAFMVDREPGTAPSAHRAGTDSRELAIAT
jgi:hypothetical protein